MGLFQVFLLVESLPSGTDFKKCHQSGFLNYFCCCVILPDFCSYWFFTRGNSSSVVTAWTVNTDGLTGNERTAAYFAAVGAPLYENWIITWGNFTPLLGNKAVPMLSSRGQTQTPPSGREAQRSHCCARLMLSMSWNSAFSLPLPGFCAVPGSSSQKGKPERQGNGAGDVQLVGICNLTAGNVVWLTYSSLGKDASSYL